jgi:hypothetical protein
VRERGKYETHCLGTKSPRAEECYIDKSKLLCYHNCRFGVISIVPFVIFLSKSSIVLFLI